MNDICINSVFINDIKGEIKKFVDERNWSKSLNPKNLAMSISIEAAELMEIFQWKTREESIAIKDTDTYEHLKEELADVMIYCISLANQVDIDISEAILEKLKKTQ